MVDGIAGIFLVVARVTTACVEMYMQGYTTYVESAVLM